MPRIQHQLAHHHRAQLPGLSPVLLKDFEGEQIQRLGLSVGQGQLVHHAGLDLGRGLAATHGVLVEWAFDNSCFSSCYPACAPSP